MKRKFFAVVISICSLELFVGNVVFGEALPAVCEKECVVEFGTIVGISNSGVTAYSNCNNACVHPVPNFDMETYTGIKWQCVEYARRWLLKNYGLVYGDVDIAADIWQLKFVSTPDKKKQRNFINVLNGSNRNVPKRGDLLIYSSEFYGTGHVAVVVKVDVDKNIVLVGEQNFNNEMWEGEYSRAIPYVVHDDKTWLLDTYLVGWKRIEF